ncbi:MAG: helix-hairpin-helix domain-containing protein [Gammaproteobacteria bacterium]|nr:helix-hairpin-helix domain-containing protein [Gammaproteobacteria bacterium]
MFQSVCKTSLALLLVLGLSTAFAVKPHSARHHAGALKVSTHVKVNFNTADAKSLMSLKGIGERKASAIIKYRKAHGPFKSLADLGKVHGISQRSLLRLEKNNPKRMIVALEK